VAASLFSWVITPTQAAGRSAKSLFERCMAEPVSVDHLACTNVYRQAHERMRGQTTFFRGSKPTFHRRTEVFFAARDVTPKPFPRSRVLRVAPALREIVRGKRPHLARNSAHYSSRNLRSTTRRRFETLSQRHLPSRTPRQYQASAFCGWSAYRSSWECERYFLLAPYGAKVR
jgi:hypothetical protein